MPPAPQAATTARSRTAKPLPCVYGLKQAVNASTMWLSGKTCAILTTQSGAPVEREEDAREEAQREERQVRHRRRDLGPADGRRDREAERRERDGADDGGHDGCRQEPRLDVDAEGGHRDDEQEQHRREPDQDRGGEHRGSGRSMG